MVKELGLQWFPESTQSKEVEPCQNPLSSVPVTLVMRICIFCACAPHPPWAAEPTSHYRNQKCQTLASPPPWQLGKVSDLGSVTYKELGEFSMYSGNKQGQSWWQYVSSF